MSDFFRRASDAFHRRQRQDSTDSTDAPKSSDTANRPDQNMPNQQAEFNQPGSRANEPPAGEAAGNDAHPKHRRYWVWGHRQEKNPAAKPQSTQDK